MDARTLLTEHPARCTRICNLKVMIRYQRKSLRQDEKSIIEMMALARTPLDGMPHAGHGGSRTEYVVLNKDKVMQAAKQDVESQTRFAVPEAGNPEEAVTDRWSKELETKGWYTAKHPARLSVSFRD